MKNFLRLLLCLSLVGFTVARVGISNRALAAPAKAAQKKPSGKKANAKTLMADAKKALAAMIKDARADKGLDPKTAKNKPFWKSTKLIAKNLKTAEKGLAAKSNDFFKGIADAREAEEQMKVDWQLTDSKNKGVIENGKKLGHALALLRTDFSKEAARKKKGGELTAKEKAQFDKIKAQQTDLLAKVKKMEKEAKKDKALEKGLHKIQAAAHHILKEPATVDAYVATLYLLDEQIGLVRGYEYYVDKDWRADYLRLETIETTYETTYSEWETSSSYEWASVNESVDIYEGEDVDVEESVSDEEINSEEEYAENESFDMSEAEEDEVAAEEDTDEEVDSDDDSMEDASDDEGDDMSDDSGGDDDGGDDDGGGDEGE
jgi:hypothetical protein